jgi:hypothetical protein
MATDDDDDLDDIDIPEAIDVPSPDLPYAPGEAPDASRWPASDGGRLDLRTWPHVAQIFMNRKAAEDLLRDLERVLQVTAPTAGLLIEYRRAGTGTTYQISADDRTPSGKTS